jgi:hypothetical protein
MVSVKWECVVTCPPFGIQLGKIHIPGKLLIPGWTYRIEGLYMDLTQMGENCQL